MIFRAHERSVLLLVACLLGASGTLHGADLSVGHVEVTQGLQSAKNDIPLIQLKPTVVRVFPVITGHPDLLQVSALLHASRGGEELPGSPLSPTRGTVNASTTVDRRTDRSALIFELPSRWTTQDTDFWVELIAPKGFMDDDPSNNRHPGQGALTARYQESGRLKIRYLTVRYRDGGPDRLPDSWTTHRDAVSWLQAVFPIAPENVSYAPWLPTELIFENPRRSGDTDSSDDLDGSALITELNTIWGTMATPDLLFAWTPANSFSRNGRSDPWYRLHPFPPGLGRVAFGNSNGERYRRTLAHEMAHNLGINCHHVRKVDDDVIGYDVNLIGPAARESALHQGGVSGTPLFDVMKAGEVEANAWIVPWTYQHVLNALTSPEQRRSIKCSTSLIADTEDTPAAKLIDLPADTSHLLAIRGQIEEDGGSFFPFYHVPAEGPFRIAASTVPSGGQGTHEVRLIGAQGEILQSIRWTPPFDQDDSEQATPSVPFTWFIPKRGDVAAVVLLRGQTRLASFIVDAEAPGIEQPQIGPVRKEDRFDGPPQELRTVKWKEKQTGTPGDPFDNKNLRHRLWFSNDDRKSWIPVATNLSSDADGEVKVEVNQALLPGGPSCRFKVTTTDGYNVTEEESPPFVLPNRPPQAHVISPRPVTTVDQGTAIRLVGEAFDLEQGILSGNQLRWWSDLQDELGRGTVLEVPNLLPGRHQIHLTATDDAENVSDPAIITVEVRPVE